MHTLTFQSQKDQQLLINSKSPLRPLCLFIVLLIICFSQTSFSQNLVPNPSFEVYTYCPVGVGAVGNLPATPWRSATNGTPDYFNACAVFPGVLVPKNGFGYQEAHTGMAYMGGIWLTELPDSSSYREYLLAPLDGIGLLAGYVYQVSFYVSLGDNVCAIDKIGAYFSRNRPPGSIKTPLDVKPQIESNLGVITDSINWVLISDCFIANGGERWITIGNFYDNDHTGRNPGCIGEYSYYFIDDIDVHELGLPDNFDFDLGGPVTACDSYQINPQLNNVTYQWNNGSTDSTLMVTESGTYFLTVTDGCTRGIDSIEIIIEEPGIVDVGPSELDLCTGDTIAIHLDPSLGQYIWQDGFEGSDYIITSAGVYHVTLNPGPCESNAEIQIHGISIPQSFSLGNDTLICPGDTLVFSPGIDDVKYLWQDGSTSPFLSIYHSDSVILTLSNECGIVSDSIIIRSIDLPPAIDLGPDTLLCKGDSIVLLSPSADYNIVWQDGSHQPVMVAKEANSYSLILSNSCGISSDSRVINLDDRTPVLDLPARLYWCEGDSVSLDATQPFEANYHWSTGSIHASIPIQTVGIYEVTVETICSSLEKQVEVVRDPDCIDHNEFYIPTVFSPNNDGINDAFEVYFSDDVVVLKIVGSIFDRWGNELYRSVSDSFSWDGQRKETVVQSGVYVYSIEVEFLMNGAVKKQTYTGSLTLIR